ncbi:extracellular solute-binding protein [Paenibacillus aceris]|uniref:Aldouronate transport system substrate-binding protein n=1 Tax=Paenibacillus aceris TaxID=869555 RepID=A0ABS4I3Y7_9BACL|nr:extracellular solute-binding protein [Paenibacillus aceris]MBP1965520.1 putative aldouronate transport system substrate-binding protein [Paenibacillus aceris]NHW33431.1 extracellular solute-binding protein [Paenibacillus aceris]
MKMKKTLYVSLAVVMTMSLLVACGKGEEKQGPAASANKEPLKIKAMLIYNGEPPVLKGNKAKEDIEKRGNVQLDLELVPEDIYKDKISIAMADSAQYDLILFDNGKDAVFTNYVKQGAFYDLTPYMKDKNNLNLIPEITWSQTKIDNKVYGIPRPRQLYSAQGAFLYRKDWLDKYSLKKPETVEEFTQVLKTFKEKDPAGGGKTIPLLTYATNTYVVFDWLASVQYAFGMPNAWTIDNGVPKFAIQSEGYIKYLEWLKSAWASGLIEKNATVLKSQQAVEKWTQGIAGVKANHVGELSDAPNSPLDKIKKVDAKAEVDMVPLLKGPDGKGGIGKAAGLWGLWVIPSSTPKDKVQKLVDFLDFSASEENYAFSKAGIIGQHSTSYKDGKVERSADQVKLFQSETPATWVLDNRYDPYYYVASDASDPVRKQMKEYTDSFEKIGITNPFGGMTSPTLTKNTDHLKKVSTVALKYVIGEGTIDDVKTEINNWVKNYGEAAGKEYMEQYNAIKK